MFYFFNSYSCNSYTKLVNVEKGTTIHLCALHIPITIMYHQGESTITSSSTIEFIMHQYQHHQLIHIPSRKRRSENSAQSRKTRGLYQHTNTYSTYIHWHTHEEIWGPHQNHVLLTQLKVNFMWISVEIQEA